MKTYTSEQPYHDGAKYYKPGEPFSSALPKADGWTEMRETDVAINAAATNPVPDDANLEAASKAALEAVAILKHVNIVGLDKGGLITAIKAAYEPKL